MARTFGGVEHRIELVRVKDGVKYYNDSIASSPSRTIAGLKSFQEKVCLIAGGYDKHIPYDVLGPYICRHTKRVYLNGATGPAIRAAVENCPDYVPGAPELVDCGDFTTAVQRAAADAVSGDIFARGLCLPSDIKNTDEDMERIIRIVRNIFEKVK